MTNDYHRAFAWYGGKNSHLHWLLELIPYGKSYVEPFAGSAAVLLNRGISEIEVLNDLDGRIINFFKVLREDGDELIRRLTLTPFSRGEFTACISKAEEEFIKEDPIEAARAFVTTIKQTFLAKPKATGEGSWGRTLHSVRRGMAQSVSGWLSIIDGLLPIVQRLKSVMIENRDALQVILDFDSPETVFYLDPPYVHDSRSKGSVSEYAHEQADDFHIRMAEILNNVEGKVALSGYESELYDKLFPAPKWFKFYPDPHKLGGNNRQVRDGGMRQEVLWTNYNTAEVLPIDQASMLEFLGGMENEE